MLFSCSWKGALPGLAAMSPGSPPLLLVSAGPQSPAVVSNICQPQWGSESSVCVGGGGAGLLLTGKQAT